jgi:hypothetical protein
MIVAWHEVPGKRPTMIPSQRARYDPVRRKILIYVANKLRGLAHTVSYGTDLICRLPRHFVPGYDHSIPAGSNAPALGKTPGYRITNHITTNP